MEKAMRVSSGSIVLSSHVLSFGVLFLMLILFIIIILIACKFKPWRRFLSSSVPSRNRSHASIKVDDIERPLIPGDLGIVDNGNNESTISYSSEVSARQAQGAFSLPHTTTAVSKRIPSTGPQLMHSDSFILDIPDTLEDSFVGQTLKRPIAAHPFVDERNRGTNEDAYYSSKSEGGQDTCQDSVPTFASNQRSILTLEVIAGPSRGLCYSTQSTSSSKLPVSIGRVAPGDVVLKDTEVSGKHAMINWNTNKFKWEVVDMGSLNGTFLNTRSVNHHQSGSRHWGNPVDLSSGDIITLGTSSKIVVQITAEVESHIPFGIGIASDPMSMRRGAKKLPMEDVCYYQWPLTGTNEFGLFGICDGHGGADAATSVSKMIPEVIARILSNPFQREKVLSQRDASDVLREAFYETESRINHYYEGCTVTALLVWADGCENFYAQCANLGDSACIINIEGKQIKMTQDHRITSYSERERFQALGLPVRDGETRICGINLARMIGDKFLKEQDARFSSEPYISEVVHIESASKSFALLASDGFWDVVNYKKAGQLVNQEIEGDGENSAEKIANYLLREARTLRTKDNTSIVFLDFNRSNSCKLVSENGQ